MQLVRSLLFDLLFYLTTAVQMIIYSPFYFLAPRKKAWFVPNTWSRVNMWLLRTIVGLKFEVEGAENMPETGCIIAPKHLSALDTFAFVPWYNDPVMILKRILMRIPLFGWYLAKMEMIAIDRGNREQAVRQVNQGARKAVAQHRQILIYPEGTRRPVGAEPAYKSGIAHLYLELGVPVVPIAHVSGLYWPKKGVMRYGGLFKGRILEPIPPGLDRETFMQRLIEVTENGCDELLLEAASRPDCPPLPPLAQARVDTLRAAQEAA